VVAHLRVVANEQLPDLVAHHEQEEHQQEEWRRAQPGVEPPAEEGEHGRGDRQLDRRRQCVTGALVKFALRGEIGHPLLLAIGPSADRGWPL
jgi:hypothetical protein